MEFCDHSVNRNCTSEEIVLDQWPEVKNEPASGEEIASDTEVVLDQWPPEVKEEYESENDQEVNRSTPPRTVVFEETDTAPETSQQTPPRRVVLEENVRYTPVKQRVGLTNDEIKREKQRTMSAKDRLGSRNSGQIND